jgi:ketosteroid isomerase-like protein
LLIAAMLTASGVSSDAEEAGSGRGPVASGASLQDAAVQLAHLYDALYGQKNFAEMANLYAGDGTLVSPSGKIVRGHDDLLAHYRQRFASGASGHKITVLETHAIGEAGYSIADFSVSVPTKPPSSETHQEHGHIAAVYSHDATGWHYRFVQPSVTPEHGQ